MIIGITGTLGAGKGTVAQYLVDHCGFRHYSVRDVLIKEIMARGLEPNRDTMTMVANDIRAVQGPQYFIEQLFSLAKEDGSNAVIESVRTLGEAHFLKEHGAEIWAVDADIYIRYARITERASETDKVSFEKFQEDEQREMQNTDPTKQNIAGVVAIADRVFRNETTREDLYSAIDAVIHKV